MGTFVDVQKGLAAAKTKGVEENPWKRHRITDNTTMTMPTYMGPYAIEVNAERRAMERCSDDVARIITTMEQLHKRWHSLSKERDEQTKRKATQLLDSTQAKAQEATEKAQIEFNLKEELLEGMIMTPIAQKQNIGLELNTAMEKLHNIEA